MLDLLPDSAALITHVLTENSSVRYLSLHGYPCLRYDMDEDVSITERSLRLEDGVACNVMSPRRDKDLLICLLFRAQIFWTRRIVIYVSFAYYNSTRKFTVRLVHS